MPTIANLPAADVTVVFPSGTRKTVNVLRLLAQVQNAEWQAKYGTPFPGLAKMRVTLKDTREEYEIPASLARTWADLAPMLRRFHTDLSEHIRNA